MSNLAPEELDALKREHAAATDALELAQLRLRVTERLTMEQRAEREAEEQALRSAAVVLIRQADAIRADLRRDEFKARRDEVERDARPMRGTKPAPANHRDPRLPRGDE